MQLTGKCVYTHKKLENVQISNSICHPFRRKGKEMAEREEWEVEFFTIYPLIFKKYLIMSKNFKCPNKKLQKSIRISS